MKIEEEMSDKEEMPEEIGFEEEIIEEKNK